METVALICVALTLARKKIGNSVIFSFIFNQEHFAPQKTRRRSARSASAATNPDALSSGYQRLSGPISPFQHSKDVLGLRLTPSERVRRTGDRHRDSLQRGAITAPTRTRLPDVDRFIDPDQRQFPLPSDKRAGSSYRLPFKRQSRNRWF